MEDFDEKVYDTDGMNFYTISEMTSILNDFGCGYNKKTIANWINDFQTDEHFQKYGEPRKRSFGTQNKKPMEYPQVWFGAVIDEHDSDIRDRIFEHAQVHGSIYGDATDEPNDLIDYTQFMENYSLSGYEYMQEEGQRLFEREDKFNETVINIAAEVLNVDIAKLEGDIYDENVSKNLLDYVRTGSEADE
ncbi:hypothetical protein [Companilactobacillus zhongbaensis]|uniref:hypothetical protein n=1 Tax=Companilactobacillus zhongbaensis TaxID=2486009 RepID=UPI000F7AF7B9|nr:hypothetical protein [Companilactobacillus zhongbaensis]